MVQRPGYGMDRPGFESQEQQEIFLFSKTVILAPGSTKHPHEVSLPGAKRSDKSANSTTHLHLVPRLRMGGIIHVLPLHLPSWRGQGQLQLINK